nr:disease resistance protein RPP13-like isoform X6 [Ipomoea batatas]
MKLRFSSMTFEGETINIFSKLSKLEVLVLEECKWIGGEWKLLEHESFDQLIYLLISESDLERWEASASHFPNLEHLVLVWCKELKKIPAEFAEIPNLKSIKVYECLPSTVDSAKEIQKEQHEQGNDNMIVIEKEGTIKEGVDREYPSNNEYTVGTDLTMMLPDLSYLFAIPLLITTFHVSGLDPN